MTSLFVLLLGLEATGKLTISRELASRIGGRVVDNQWINNPIFGLLDVDRLSPMPEGVWPIIHRVREAVLEAMATLSPRTTNFIMTYAGLDHDAEDHKNVALIQATAVRRGALFVPVRLLCSDEERARRIVMPDRASRLKSMNPSSVRRSRGATPIDPRHPNQLTLDVTNISPMKGADLIGEHIATLRTPR